MARIIATLGLPAGTRTLAAIADEGAQIIKQGAMQDLVDTTRALHKVRCKAHRLPSARSDCCP